MAADTKQVDFLIKRHQKLLADRANWESHWQDLVDYCSPNKSGVITIGTSGEKRMTRVFDSTAIRAPQIMADGIHAGLTTGHWFDIIMENEQLMDNEEVSAWIETAENKIYEILTGSNFNGVIQSSYEDDAVIGTSTIYIEQDAKIIRGNRRDEVKMGLRFKNLHVSEIAVCEDSRGVVDTIFRKFNFTARQANQEWGKRAGEKITKALETEPEKEFPFLNVVLPRTERDASKLDNLNMPFASLYIDPEKKMLVDEQGYRQLPYIVFRWRKNGNELYGRSQAMTALPDIKMLNEVRKTNLKAAQVAVDPPLIVPHDGVLGKIRLTPGGVNYILTDAWDKGRKPEAMNLGKDVILGLEVEKDIREHINLHFFVNLFLSLTERPDMTATEIIERVQEKVNILGSAVGSLMSDKLAPILHFIFSFIMYEGLIPSPPAILSNQGYRVDFVSPLAKFQKYYQVEAIRRTFQDISPYIEIMPEMLDNVDPDKTFDIIADTYGFPQKGRRPIKLVQAIRDARSRVAEEEVQKAEADRLIQSAVGLKKAGIDVATTEA